MVDDFLHGPDGSQGVTVTINDCWGHKKVTQVAKLSKNIVVLYLNVDLFGFL
jgi:hypothetical protein